MAAQRISTRQKMINMMYLVLLALLALNVSKETLDVIVKVDKGMTKTTKNFEAKNNQQYIAFENQYFLNAEKVGPWKEKADELKLRSDELFDKINEYKYDIVKRADRKNANLDSIRNIEDLNASAEIMIKEDGGRRANDLRASIESYRNFLLTMLTKADSSLSGSIIENLATPDPPRDIHTAGRTWQQDIFEDLPLIGVMALMTKIQADIRNAESDVLNYLYKEISAQEFKFNKLQAIAIPRSNYVFQGDVFEAEIFMVASDTTQEPQILVGNSPLQVQDGKATYRVNTTSTGYKRWGGIIRYTSPDGSINNYPFEGEYEVAPPSIVVSPTKMNVFYMGVPNPVDLSIAGVSADKIVATITNGQIENTPDGYFVYPDKSFGTSTITLFESTDDGRKIRGSKDFRLKPLPYPVAKVNSQKGGRIDKNVLLLQFGVEAALDDFLFDLHYTVTQFTITSIVNKYADDESSNSERFTDAQKDLIRGLRRGNKLYIEDIKAIGPDKIVRDLQGIMFRIN